MGASPEHTLLGQSARLLGGGGGQPSVGGGAQPLPARGGAAEHALAIARPARDYEQRCDALTDEATLALLSTQRRRYCALLLLTDEVVGELVASLKELVLWRDRLLIFTTDNGGETARGASNTPFRGTKGEPFEGSTR